MTTIKSRNCPIRRVGQDAGHHFFGYYNKTPWDASGRRLLAQRVPWLTRDLGPDDRAEVGWFDLDDGDRFHVVGETTAWNWQMGAQLQWLGGARDTLCYNVRDAGAGGAYPGFAARVQGLDGAGRLLPEPIYVLAPDGRFAICVDYRRFNVTHPTIGYADPGAPAPVLAPEDDGIRRMDLPGGATTLIVSLAQLTRHRPLASMEGAIHWVTHLEMNPAGDRILFIHRWTRRVEDETCFLHRLYSVCPDGSGLTLLECTDHPIPHLDAPHDPNRLATFDYEKSEYQISHPTWRGDRHIMVWGPHAGAIHYQLYDIETGDAEAIGTDVLVENGHMTYSPDGRWMISDTYPDKETNIRKLFLYDTRTGIRTDIADLATIPTLGKENRCDLHPRWRPDGRAVCVDSVHEGERQMYIVDVTPVTEATDA